MKKLKFIISLLISALLFYACTLRSDTAGDNPAGTTTIQIEVSGLANEKSSGVKSLINDDFVLSVTVTAQDSTGASLGTATLTKGTSSWKGSLDITVTGSELVTFRARGWSGLAGAGSVLYYGISGVTVTSADETLNVSIGTVLQNMTWTKITTLGDDRLGATAIASSADGETLALMGYLYNDDPYPSSYLSRLYTSTNSGESWTKTTFDTLKTWNDIAISADGTYIAAVTEDGEIYISTDSGASWDPYTVEGVTGYTHIKISDNPKTLVAMGFSLDDGKGVWMPKLCTSTDSGVSWNVKDVSVRQTWDGESYIRGMAISANGTKVAAVDDMGIYTSADSGTTWQFKNFEYPFYGIASSADGTKLAAVAGGTYGSGSIKTSPDAGVTWTEQTGAGIRSWVSIACSSDGTKLSAAPYMGNIYTSADAGATWTAQSSAGIRAWTLKGITCSGDGTKLAAFNEFGSDGSTPPIYTFSSIYTAGY